MRWLARWLPGLAVCVLLAIATATGATRWVVESIDRHWLGEWIKDQVGKHVWREDWHAAPVVGTALDYSWLAAAGRPLRVAHALGAPAMDDQNSLRAAQASLAAGMRVLEVDLWLDDAERLRCHHGPGDLPPYGPDSCTLERLLRLTAASGAFVVLDIKTDFARTAGAVLSSTDPLALRRVIFQLYRPEHLALFEQWMGRHALPGPIVTAYLAHRSLNHLADVLAPSRIQVLAVPVARLPALRVPHRTVLVHPIADCSAWQAAVASGRASGAYVPSSLDCTTKSP